VAYLYFNFSSIPGKPWAITETNIDRTERINIDFASDVEINVPCKTFANRFHYFTCEGVLTWDGTKAIINAE
jgi:hypothetical protein